MIRFPRLWLRTVPRKTTTPPNASSRTSASASSNERGAAVTAMAARVRASPPETGGMSASSSPSPSGASPVTYSRLRAMTTCLPSAMSGCSAVIRAIASRGLGLVGEPALARLIEPAFGWLRALSDAAFEFFTFVLAFAIVTYVTTVIGELAPKYLAIQRALPLALWTAYPLHVFYRLMYPFIAMVNVSADAILAWVGIRPTDELSVHSEEELKMLVAISTKKGVLQESERVIVGRAMEFADRIVRQVMVPRTEIVDVPDDAPIADLLSTARLHRFSRLPVYQEDLDHVIGITQV